MSTEAPTAGAVVQFRDYQRLQEALDKLDRDYDARLAERDELKRQVERLREALTSHGHHLNGCDLARIGGDCNCGYRAALAESKPSGPA